MEMELKFLTLKLQFLNTLCEDELDKVMFFFANLSDNSESGIDDEVLEECEAYGVTWGEILSFMKDIREREKQFVNELANTPNKDIYAVLNFFIDQLMAGQDIFDELAKMLHSRCNVKKDAVLALSIACEALFANKTHELLTDTRVFAGGALVREPRTLTNETA